MTLFLTNSQLIWAITIAHLIYVMHNVFAKFLSNKKWCLFRLLSKIVQMYVTMKQFLLYKSNLHWLWHTQYNVIYFMVYPRWEKCKVHLVLKYNATTKCFIIVAIYYGRLFDQAQSPLRHDLLYVVNKFLPRQKNDGCAKHC